MFLPELVLKAGKSTSDSVGTAWSWALGLEILGYFTQFVAGNKLVKQKPLNPQKGGWRLRCTLQLEMFPYLKKCEPPSDDKRWEIIAATMRKLGNERHGLIETLHSLQQTFGHLDKAGLTYVAASLKIPLSKVYGAATFYNHFTMKPQGKHACVVCTGTACHIKGAPDLLRSLAETEGIKPGETTAGGEVTVLTARCFGTCGLAPVVTMDGDFLAYITPEALEQKLREAMERAC